MTSPNLPHCAGILPELQIAPSTVTEKYGRAAIVLSPSPWNDRRSVSVPAIAEDSCKAHSAAVAHFVDNNRYTVVPTSPMIQRPANNT